MNREAAITELIETLREAEENNPPKYIAMLSAMYADGERETKERVAVLCSRFSPEDCRKAIAIIRNAAKTDPELSQTFNAAVDFISVYLLGVSA